MELFRQRGIFALFRGRFIIACYITLKIGLVMDKLNVVAKTLALTLAASTFAFAALADGAPKFLGNTTASGEIPEDFGTYWNQITAENECTWSWVEKERGTYDFSDCDAVYNWAKEHRAYFSYHTLIWGSHNPEWLSRLDSAETKKAITEWMDAVQGHFPDLDMIEVVNEAVKSGVSGYHSAFARYKIVEALGGDDGDYKFVATAFRMARERWPKAILIYNDHNTIMWQKAEAIDLVKKVKAQGGPIDGFGMQFHETYAQGSSASCIPAATLKTALQDAYEQTGGTPIFITQYDVGTEDDQLQKSCYETHMPVLMESEYVSGVTLWGYVYGATWTTNGNSGLIKDGIDRPAMTWLKEYFAEKYPYTPLGPEEPSAIAQNLYFSPNTLQKFELYNARGVRLGVFTAHSFEAAEQSLRNSGTLKPSGVYYLRNHSTRIVRLYRYE